MNREIRYRAWDIKNKKYIEIIGFYIHGSFITLWFLDDEDIPDFVKFHRARIKLEQYTGYFDSYFGDTAIVSGEEPYSNNQFNTDYDWTFEGVIKEVDGVIVVEDESKCGIPFCDIINSDMDIKITGNIHENKGTE